MSFLQKTNIKFYNYSHNCEQNLPTKKEVTFFEFKLSNENYSKSTDLDPSGKIIIQKIKCPSILKMKFQFSSENKETSSQEQRLSDFKKKKEEQRAKAI